MRNIFLLFVFISFSLTAQGAATQDVICEYNQDLEIIVDHFEEGELPQVHLGPIGTLPRQNRGQGRITVLKAQKGDNGTFLIEGVVRSRKTYHYTMFIDPRVHRVSMVTTVSEGTNKETGEYESNITGYPLTCSYL